jgi:hypothetical protein
MFLDARHLVGVGQARTRARRAVERTVPFGLVCYSLAIVWYAQHGQPAHDLAARRALAPWYQTKTAPSVADMLATLRRVLLAAQYRPGQPAAPTAAEILQVQAAWAPPQPKVRKPSTNRTLNNPRYKSSYRTPIQP